MKIKSESWLWLYTLDEVAETFPIGGIGDLYKALWGAMVEDDRELEYPDQKFSGPNIVARALEDGRLGTSELVELQKAYREEFPPEVILCCYCGKHLTAKKSIERGYGPHCGKMEREAAERNENGNA